MNQVFDVRTDLYIYLQPLRAFLTLFVMFVMRILSGTFGAETRNNPHQWSSTMYIYAPSSGTLPSHIQFLRKLKHKSILMLSNVKEVSFDNASHGVA